MKKLILIMGVTAMLFACSSPMDKKVNKETIQEDMADVIKNLDSTDMKTMITAMFSLKLQGTNLESMTYREILEKGKEMKAKQEKIEAEQKIMADKAAAEEADRIERLNRVVMVSCFDKGYEEYDYNNYITYKFAINNKSDKNIRAFKGTVTFTNLFGDKIKTINFMYDQPIKSGQNIKWNASSDYNQFLDDDVALKNKDLKDMKVVWTPYQIIFEDGSTLE